MSNPVNKLPVEDREAVELLTRLIMVLRDDQYKDKYLPSVLALYVLGNLRPNLGKSTSNIQNEAIKILAAIDEARKKTWETMSDRCGTCGASKSELVEKDALLEKISTLESQLFHEKNK